MRDDDELYTILLCEFEPGKKRIFTLKGLENKPNGPTDSMQSVYERFFKKVMEKHYSSYIKKEEVKEEPYIDMTEAVDKFYEKENPTRDRGRFCDYVEKVYNNLGLAVVCYGGADFEESYGCFDKDGNFVIPREYQIEMTYGDGLFATYDSSLTGGYINTKGETVIPFQYQSVGEFENGYAFVVTEDEEIQYIDKTGRPVMRITSLTKIIKRNTVGKIMKKVREREEKNI